ncbi:ubiquinone biosynthesis accessory factor UbiJ [Marinobacterium arenosum]|uniref:ubiquinone biosynthesis accessory factor UbiJ n=1 Tax=Marinobacterium arenosum TaxID=2862496 RepID=UPI001C938838|nr:SCP2 sterol-binding domain-containing protein [Marinobacterium arenosum]MBY4678065.1 SCP2 sterol-binding domain-containing protein [Marinobacterium arenosum]
MLELLNATLLTVAEQSINGLLGRDPVTLERLAGLEGKVIVVELSAPTLRFSLMPCADGLQLYSQLDTEADVTLRGLPADFVRLLGSADQAEAMFGNGIEVQGDSGLATRLQKILADARIDWEAQLAELIGDLPAHQLANLVGFKVRQYRTTGDSLLANLQEYIKEESQLLAPRPEVEAFMAQIDRLRDDSDRLAARFERLRSQVFQDRD